MPEFYARDADGIPQTGSRACAARCARNGPAFGAGRMLEDYERRVYGAAVQAAP